MNGHQRAQLVAGAGRYFAERGITTVCEADLRRDALAIYAEADDQGTLPLRVHGLAVHEEVGWLAGSGLRGRRSSRLSTEGVKIWADGGMSSRTAAIHGTYPVPPFGSGILFYTSTELMDLVGELNAQGFQVAIHAQGDRAIGAVLDAYASVLDGPGTNPGRHRIEHGGAMYPELVTRAASLGIIVVSQPGFLSTLGDGFVEAFGDRAGQLYPFASWRDAGIVTAGSSDAPVISADVLLGIRDVVLRRTAGGTVLGPAERLDVRDALDLYTRGAAFAVHREKEIGSLGPGKLADFTVLDGNPLTTSPDQLTDLRVLATVVGGAVTYQDGDLLPADWLTGDG
jgi:predicted amidohydrolase YtcJ